MADTLQRLQTAFAGRYVLERELGRGGMATVYLARDTANERDVAVKVMHPELSASLGGDRFLREIQLAEKLQHPGIMGMYDSGQTGDLLYYVMPFIEGESLRDRLERESQLPLEDAVDIARQVAEALAVAHANDVVHRDIKPENILLTGERVVVADFGIARAVTVAGGEKLTQTGMAIGTPVYMSPEQASGERGIDGRADQYALACVLYEMLAGQPPYTGPTPMAIMARHALDTVPSIRIVRSTIPENVDESIQQALSKVPVDRFPTIDAFARALADPSAPRRHTVATAVFPAVRRPKWHRWAAAAVVVAAVGGGAAWLGARGGPPVDLGDDARRLAVLYFDHAEGDSALGYLAAGLSEDLMAELARVPALSVISQNGVEPYRNSATPADSIAAALRVGLVVDGTVERADGAVRVNLTLINGRNGEILEKATVQQPEGDVLAIRDTLTVEAAALIRRRVGDVVQLRERRSTTADQAAWDLVQRADALERVADSIANLPADDSAASGIPPGTALAYDQADSILALAQARDPRWTEPVVRRGRIAYERSRLLGADAMAAGAWVTPGLALADQALQISPRDPDALELRGTLRYWKWLLQLGDPQQRDELLATARADLEAATKLNQQQAGAWYILAHLYNQIDGVEEDANLAAQRAYESDAYLRNADGTLSRLWTSSYDLGRFAAAKTWCDEGRRRFPAEPSFVECQLWLMSVPNAQPDIPRAWALADTMTALAPPARQDFQRLVSHMVVAAALAQAGLDDSSRAVARRSRGDAIVDPTRDLAMMEAFVHTRLDQPDSAIAALKTYIGTNPARRSSIADGGWWFRSLEDNPEFQTLVGTAR